MFPYTEILFRPGSRYRYPGPDTRVPDRALADDFFEHLSAARRGTVITAP